MCGLYAHLDLSDLVRDLAIIEGSTKSIHSRTRNDAV
jgi:hypothetical protein